MEAIEQPRGIQPQTPILDDHEAEMARAAQRCIMAALDHSRAATIALVSEDAEGPPATVKVPPAALRVIAQVLGAMGERKAVTIVPSNHEVSTIQAAHFLNVSRPFVIKERPGPGLLIMAGGGRYTALLDACVLFPPRLADALISLHAAGSSLRDGRTGSIRSGSTRRVEPSPMPTWQS